MGSYRDDLAGPIAENKQEAGNEDDWTLLLEVNVFD